MPSNLSAIYEKIAGYINPEKSIEYFLKFALENKNVQIMNNEKVKSYQKTDKYIRILTGNKEIFTKKVIFSCGPYITTFFPELPLKIQRKHIVWFKPIKKESIKNFKELPIFYINLKKGKTTYGFPDLGNGVKTAFHFEEENFEVKNIKEIPFVNINEVINKDKIEEIRKESINYFKNFGEFKVGKLAVCYYTVTPDENFIFDFIDKDEKIFVISACSGHGFKFAPILGKICSEIMTEKKINFDISPFKLSRFDKKLPKF